MQRSGKHKAGCAVITGIREDAGKRLPVSETLIHGQVVFFVKIRLRLYFRGPRFVGDNVPL